jgi:NADPH-dependent curcumin reductase CurA
VFRKHNTSLLTIKNDARVFDLKKLTIKMKNVKFLFLAIIWIAATSLMGCKSVSKTQKGAVIGTAAGGATGAVIGRAAKREKR